MLAQNFKTADELGISDEQLSALIKTLALMDSGKLEHFPQYELDDDVPESCRAFSGKFNMNAWASTNTKDGDCGTVCCIGGTAELIGKVTFSRMGRDNHQLRKLFFPPGMDSDWEHITVAKAAMALRSYLTTGDARWDLALAE